MLASTLFLLVNIYITREDLKPLPLTYLEICHSRLGYKQNSMIWKIANGDHINLWNKPWIAPKQTLRHLIQGPLHKKKIKPLSHPLLLMDLGLSALYPLIFQMRFNLEFMQSIFPWLCELVTN